MEMVLCRWLKKAGRGESVREEGRRVCRKVLCRLRESREQMSGAGGRIIVS